MATTATLPLTVWRNDDVYELPLRVRGLDLTDTALAMQVRLQGDAPGAPLIDLAKVTNGNAEGLRVALVRVENGVPVSEVRIRINKSSRQALPYMGEAGDTAVFEYALLIGGRTRLVGPLLVPAHAFGSDAAPAARPANWGTRSDVGLPGAGATLTIASDDAVQLTIDGAGELGALIDLATTAAAQATTIAASMMRLVQTYGDRDAIPGPQRFAGLLVYVAAVDLWFEYRGDPATDLGNAGWIFPSWLADNRIIFVDPPVLDGDVLYFPDFYILAYGQNGYGEYYYSPGGRVASPISTDTDVRRHVFDRRVIREGGSLADAISEVENNSAPQRDTHDQVVLAVTRGGQLIDTLGHPFVGRVPGGAVPNEYRYGRAVDEAPFIFPTAAPMAITDPDMLAAGFTRGIRGAPNGLVSYGDYRPTPIRKGDYLVARFRLIAEQAGNFGQPRLYLYTSEPQADFVVPSVFREISPKVREYLYVGRAAADYLGKWAVGTDAQAFASRVWVAGAQFHCGPDPAFWIDTTDYSAPIDAAPLMADRLYMVSDRALPLIAANGLVDRATEAMVEVAASPAPALPTAAQPYFDSGRAQDVLWLDPAAISAGLAVSLRAREAPHLVHARTVPVSVRQVPIAPRRAINVGYFGDSHSSNLFARYLKVLLAAWGVDVTFYGSLDSAIGDEPGEVRQYGEGRGSWGLANFFGARAGAWDTVLGAGQAQTDAYRAGDFALRQRTNPFLSNAASQSTAPVIAGALPVLGGGTAGGFRLDLVAYRNRFALPALDIVLVNLGQNDINQQGAAGGLAEVDRYYPILLAEIRRAWPATMILGWGEAPAYVDRSEVRWRERRPAAVSQLAAVRARTTGGDAKVRFASTWMHHTVRSGFPLAVGAVDPITRTTRTTIADPVHPDPMARAQSLEALAAAIINLLPTNDGIPAGALISRITGTPLVSRVDGTILVSRSAA